MGNKFPRPNDINFQNTENKIQYHFREVSKIDSPEKVFLSLCTLQSGNILISYNFRNDKILEFKSGISIYSVPKLRLVENYIFKSEIDGVTYSIDSAIQLINGNIFAICDSLYIFDGENIKDGPKTKSGIMDEGSCKSREIIFIDPEDKFKIRKVKKNGRTFLCDFMMEIKEGFVIYTYEGNQEIYLLDIGNLETSGTEVYSLTFWELDIIHKSEYYPENLYVCANLFQNKSKSQLLIFNIDEFCNKENKSKRKPSHTMVISESQNVFGICEYNKKYLLLDTIKNGIYIIDIESRQKVAVSALKSYDPNANKGLNMLMNLTKDKIEITKSPGDRFAPVYRNMEKLKDGQVLIVETGARGSGRFFIADIREQQKVGYFGSSGKFVLLGNYIASLYVRGTLVVLQICED